MGEEALSEFYKIPADEIIDRRVWDLPLIEKEASIDHVLSILTGRDHVWVVESKGSRKLVGIITEHDILCVVCPTEKNLYLGMPEKHHFPYEFFEKAEKIMSKDPIKCRPDETVKDVLDKMMDYKVRRVPVVDDGDIIGEINLHELIIKFYDFIKSKGEG
ncbi:MAG TPA: CBS domain-containing protein [Thermoplasmatales archaeon]|nr:MAG: CBS domain-containing protein [Thermoplasmata archaeon]HDH81462.1 CBS domain-containing protein [Thermoplasmatales archaeon]